MVRAGLGSGGCAGGGACCAATGEASTFVVPECPAAGVIPPAAADAPAGGGALPSDACVLRSTGCSLTTLTCVDSALSLLKCLPASPPFNMYTDPTTATPANATAGAISFQACERVSVACRAKPCSHHTRKSSTSTAGKASASTAVMSCVSVRRANLDSPFVPRAVGAQFPRQ